MSITLDQILALVGKLDDTPGDDTPRERFRHFLRENINEVGQIRDYIEECLRKSGDQYSRALQDLVNHLGRFLEFEVVSGRYQGVQKQIGFDGHWKSPSTGLHMVIEVKTTETYAVKTSTLVGYVDALISDKSIPSWDQALGLYVVGRPDPEIRQLENAILAEKRTDQLRLINVESLLALAEMMNEYDVGHEDVLAVMRPSGAAIDPIVDVMTRLVAEPKTQEVPETEKEEPISQASSTKGEAGYWLTPVKSDKEQTAEKVIQILVGQEKIYAFGDRTPGRKNLKPGDWICFYASGKGIIAQALVASYPEKKPNPKVRHSEKYPWVFRLQRTKLYINEPIVLDRDLRNQLDAFWNRDPNMSWAWFVQATHKITEHDFRILTRDN